MLGEVAETELLHQALRKALPDGEGVVLGPLVLAPVVDMEVVGGNVVIPVGGIAVLQGTAAVLLLLHLGEGDILRLPVAAGLLVVEHGVVAEFLPDILLQHLHRHLDHLDGLDLERRKLLLQRLFGL